MAFSKTFPKSSDKSVYPRWEEIYLSEEEERNAEIECRERNIRIMQECIDDAKGIVHEKRLLENQNLIIDVARSLFEKRASHEIFHKENRAKEKFNKELKK